MKKGVLEKLNRFNRINENKFLVSVDWLELHVKTDYEFEEQETSKFTVHLTGRSKTFRSIYTIKLKATGEVIATYATDAVEALFNGERNHGILKIENKQLYTYATKLREFTSKLLRRFSMQFIGITRMDICYDFHKFHNNRCPENFIKAFLRGDILKSKPTKFKVTGVHKDKNYFDWITFGAKTSTVNYKLYNKTKEQDNEVKKPYIWQLWDQAGLNTKEDIWRVEFSINSNTNTLINDYTNIKFHSLEMLDFHNYTFLFPSLFEHYFKFVKNDRTKKRKDRMKEVILLTFPKPFVKTKFNRIVSSHKNADRSTKIFIKKLEGLRHDLRGFDETLRTDGKTIISKLIGLYSLEHWAQKRRIDYDNETAKKYAPHLDELIYSRLTSRNRLTEEQIKQLHQIGGIPYEHTTNNINYCQVLPASIQAVRANSPNVV